MYQSLAKAGFKAGHGDAGVIAKSPMFNSLFSATDKARELYYVLTDDAGHIMFMTDEAKHNSKLLA